MVARPGTFQASQNSGELAPEMWGRTDIKNFYSGMALMKNVEPVPQGGSRLTPRTRHLGRVRSLLQTLDVISTVLHTGPHTVAADLAVITFTAPRNVSVVSLPGFAASIALGAILQVQWSDGITTQSFGAPFTSGPGAVNHTIALPPGTSVLTTVITLRMVSAPPGSVTFTLPSIAALTETGTKPPAARVRPFTFGLDQTYCAVLANGFADFYRDGVFVGSALTPFVSSQIAALKLQQRFDTMLLFHEDVPSQRIFRNGADNEWNVDSVPYTSIPRVDLGGAYTNQVTDIWQVYLRYPTTGSFAAGINLFVSLDVSGEETPGVGTGGAVDWAVFAAALRDAIIALPSVGPGVTVSQDHSTAGVTVFTISFGGADNNGTRNTLSAQVVNTSEAAATVTHTQLGVPGGEDLFSTAAGWPATGNFYQERLITGGFRSKRGALLASVTGDYYDNNIDIISANGANLDNIYTDGAERLHHLARARHLVLFTSEAEYFISDRVLSRTAQPTIVNCSRNGSAANVPIVESEGSLIYVSRNGNLIYTATYDDVSQAYVSQPISLLASHIASNIGDMALQKPSLASDAARLWQVRADGTMCVGVMLRNQDVTAFVRWETSGLVQSTCVDGLNVPHLLVERTVGAATELHFERLELGLIFDGTIDQTFVSPVTVVPNLGAHEGAEVWAVCDGFTEGPFTVSGGSITLPEASSVVSVGRWTPPRAIPLPLPSEVAERIVLKRPKRVHTVRIELMNTTSVAIGANGRPPRDVALYRAGDAADLPLPPVTRQEAITGLTGFSPEGQIEITQLKPGLLAWTGFTREART